MGILHASQLLITIIAVVVLSSRAMATIVVTHDVVTVQMAVVSSCTISANILNFGNYDSFAAIHSSASLNVTCTNATPYQIGLNAGTGLGATIITRKMSSGNDTLNYSLYQDVNRTVVWGDVQNINTVSGVGTGLSQFLIVYAEIPLGQSSAIGKYSDIVVATVYF